MYLKIGFLGHVFTISFEPDEEEECEIGIGGGAGGIFERYEEPVIEYWEEPAEDRSPKIGFF